MNNSKRGSNSMPENIIKRIKERDFSGDAGQAIKNSGYQLTTSLIMKIGALIFTILAARMMLPEKYGLYVLTLSTILIFFSFSDFGIKSAMIVFASKSLSKNDGPKAKGYMRKLLSWKIILLSISSFMLLVSSYFIANVFYNKPIFFALLFGVIYLPIVGMLGFVETIFYVENKFKYPLIKEIAFQLLRLILVPISIFLLLKMSISSGTFTSIVILMVTISYLLSLLILVYLAKKNISFIRVKPKNLNSKETLRLKKFLYPLGAIALSGVFFGYIDIIMLGRYVSEEFIAYYGATFTLITSAAAILMFGASGLAPIFARTKGENLERLFKKTRNFTLLLTILASVFTYLLARQIINIIYGSNYSPAILLLQIFSILIVILPATSVYATYYISRERTKILAILLIASTILNITLNYFFIGYGLRIGTMYAVIGACIATIISRTIYLLSLISLRKVY